MTACRSAAILFALVALAPPAALGDVQLSTSGCDLDLEELRRLVRLELSGVSGTTDHAVGVQCEADGVQLRITDPLTSKKIQRTTQPPPPDHPEPERLIALTLAQLYRASWLELMADDSAPLPPREPSRATPRELDAARRAARGVVPSAPARIGWFVGLGGDMQHRGALLYGPAVSGGYRLSDPLQLMIRLQAMRGKAHRDTGDVEVQLLGGTLGAAWRTRLSDQWFVSSGLLIGPAHVRLEGRHTARGFSAGLVQGWALDAQLRLGPVLIVEPFVLQLSGLAGALLGPPTGRVAQDEDVALDGLLLGLAFDLHWDFSRR